jgi:hypothetical protein
VPVEITARAPRRDRLRRTVERADAAWRRVGPVRCAECRPPRCGRCALHEELFAKRSQGGIARDLGVCGRLGQSGAVIRGDRWLGEGAAWRLALEANPLHPETTYNYGLRRRVSERPGIRICSSSCETWPGTRRPRRYPGTCSEMGRTAPSSWGHDLHDPTADFIMPDWPEGVDG